MTALKSSTGLAGSFSKNGKKENLMFDDGVHLSHFGAKLLEPKVVKFLS